VVVALVEQDNEGQAEQSGSQYQIIRNAVPVHVAHLGLQSPGRRNYYNGLFRAGGKLQPNCVERVAGESLLDDGRFLQAVIAVKSRGVMGDRRVNAQCRRFGSDENRGDCGRMVRKVSLKLTSRNVLRARVDAKRYSERERQQDFWAEFHRLCFLPWCPDSFLHSRH